MDSTSETRDAERRASASSSMLAGLTVLDFTRVLAGPYCTRLMADLGADVIKVERPEDGDEMRRSPAIMAGDGNQSTYFVRRNAGKKSIAIDLSLDAGRAVAHDLTPRGRGGREFHAGGRG